MTVERFMLGGWMIVVLSLVSASFCPEALAWSPHHTSWLARDVQRMQPSSSRPMLHANTKDFIGTRPHSALSVLPSRSSSASSSSSSSTPLEAVALSSTSSEPPVYSSSPSLQQQQQPQNEQDSSSSSSSFWWPVVSAALLITGNTFGAGSLVLPTLAAGPGLGPSTAVFVLAYTLNLLSGLTLAHVAITQYEQQQDKEAIPSSFQEFVQTNLDSPELAVTMSGISFVMNSLVLAFDISRVGCLLQGALQHNPLVACTAWSGLLFVLVATQSSHRLSQVASGCVLILFASFASLLVPGLASLTNPLGDWLVPGTAAYDSSLWWHSLTELAPVVVVCTIFQNIVPTICQLLQYERRQSMTAIVLGSSLPLFMYIAWCWACLGQGGLDLTATMHGMTTNPLFVIFSLATLAGSSIGCSLSCASEMEQFVQKQQQRLAQWKPLVPPETTTTKPRTKVAAAADSEGFQWITVLATVAFPWSLNVAFSQGGDLTSALHWAGGLGSPILYGIIPALMAYQQLQNQQQQQQDQRQEEQAPSIMGQQVGFGVLGAASTGLFCGNLADGATALWPSLPTAAAAAVALTEAVPI